MDPWFCQPGLLKKQAAKSQVFLEISEIHTEAGADTQVIASSNAFVTAADGSSVSASEQARAEHEFSLSALLE